MQSGTWFTTLIIFSLLVFEVATSVPQRVLKFNPTDVTNFTTAITNDRRSIHAGDTTGDTTYVSAKHELRRVKAGFVMNTRPLNTRKTSVQNDRLAGLFTQLSYNQKLDSMGFAYSISGHEKLSRLIDSAFPPDTAAALKAILQPDVLAAREMGEWNGRMANVSGRSLLFNVPVIDTSFYTMPGGARLKYYIISRLTDTLRIQGKWCLQASITAATNPLDLATISRLPLKSIVDLFKIPDTVLGRYPAGKGAMRATTDLYVEMSTLLPRTETSQREIDYDIVVDTNRVYYRGRTIEVRTVQFQYQQDK